jgi:hypothetical protein
LISNLCSVAEPEGPNRILRSPGRFHHPLGEPSLPPDEEQRWRLWLTRAALATLQRPVTGPTVFDPEAVLAFEQNPSSRV